MGFVTTNHLKKLMRLPGKTKGNRVRLPLFMRSPAASIPERVNRARSVRGALELPRRNGCPFRWKIKTSHLANAFNPPLLD